jgi:ribonuclease J
MLEGVAPFLDQDAFKTLPRDKIVVLCTGSQGEPRAAIARIARGEHPAIDLNAGDRVIFSSWAIPGNEREVIDIQNMLIDRGIEVITQHDGLVHTTGHPRREELMRLYDWLKPVTLVPVHGEAAHLEAHAALGRQHGIQNVVHARNGDMVRLFPDVMQFPGEVRTGELYLDGNILCTPEESGVKGRRRLSFGGHIVVSLCVDARGTIVAGPDLAIEGLPEVEDDEDSVSVLVRNVVNGALKSIPPKRRADPDLVDTALQRAIRGEVNAWWGKKPNVTVFVHRV